MPPNCVTFSDHIVSMRKALTNASMVKPFVELLNIGIACASWRGSWRFDYSDWIFTKLVKIHSSSNPAQVRDEKESREGGIVTNGER